MIQITDLNKKFGSFQVLNQLSLHVNTGSIYGLIGTNGAGKTTVIKHLTGVLRGDSGKIQFDNEDIYDNTNIKSNLGYIPDELYFFNNYKINEMGRFYKGIFPNWDDEYFKLLVKQFNLPEEKKLSTFSKGMQKQAAFSLVLATRPKYLILDEPIDGLDPLVRKTVWNNIVQNVAENNMTTLISSHNLREMEGICDSIGIIEKGNMLLERDLDELKTDIHKVQIAFKDDKTHNFDSLNVLHHEKHGSVELLIIRDPKEKVTQVIQEKNPAIFDMLPLSLEEIFIYELGGTDHEFNNILF